MMLFLDCGSSRCCAAGNTPVTPEFANRDAFQEVNAEIIREGFPEDEINEQLPKNSRGKEDVKTPRIISEANGKMDTGFERTPPPPMIHLDGDEPESRSGTPKVPILPSRLSTDCEFDVEPYQVPVVPDGFIPAFAFVETQGFNGFIGGFIFLNAILMGVELDIDLGTAGEVFEHLFTSIWTLEMILKMLYLGVRQYFMGPGCGWNRTDCVLACISILDVWILPFVTDSQGMRMVTVLRVIRLTRLFRMMKFLRNFEELWLLVNGLIHALSVLCWVFILFLIIVYVGAVFVTSIIGKDCDAPGYDDFADCHDMFGSMLGSMYTLYQVITLESWSMAIVRPVLKNQPFMIIFFLVFMLITSFGLMNIVMGVIVEQTLQHANENEQKLEQKKVAKQQAELQVLQGVFQQADLDNSGMVSLEEFLTVCERIDVQEMFEILELPVSRPRLAQRLFDVLDGNSSGEIKIDEFVEAMQRLKAEGRGLLRDQTLLLMETRVLGRKLNRIEKTIGTGGDWASRSKNSPKSKVNGIRPRTEIPDDIVLDGIPPPTLALSSSQDSSHVAASKGPSQDFVDLKAWLEVKFSSVEVRQEEMRQEFGTRVSALEARVAAMTQR